jgi:hypothetical protein
MKQASPLTGSKSDGMRSTIGIATLLPILVFASLVSGGCASVSSAESASAVSQLKIDGVGLGMTSTQALSALKRRGLVPTLAKAPCVSDYLAMHQRTVSLSSRSGHCVSMVSVTTQSGTLLISFVEDIPNHPRESTVTSVSFNEAKPGAYDSHSPELEAALREAGAPSLTDGKKPWVVAMWCEGFKCGDMDAALQDPNSGVMLVVHRGSGLALTFDSYAAKRREAAYRILTEHHITITD